MKLQASEDLFKELWPFIIDENVTDIKWNGSSLWITDLNKGRVQVKGIELSEEWLKIFTGILSNSVNENFNISEPSLMAETDELRIQAEHSSTNGENKTCLAIRKTPSVSRLHQRNLIEDGYVDEFILSLLPCLMRARLSGIITGDVGSGKTELEKYLCSFIPNSDPIVTLEDTLELKLKKLYPNKDIISFKTTNLFNQEKAIKDALRLNTKWLIISESRGRDIARIMEGASSGCVALTSIHAENVEEIPDRIMNMVGEANRPGFENDIYTFFDYAIKVKADFTSNGVKRRIDQICFFERTNNSNVISPFIKEGKVSYYPLPKRILKRFIENNELPFLGEYRKFLKQIQQHESERATISSQ